MGATLVAVHGFLIVVTSLVMELRLWAMGASGVATPGPEACYGWAWFGACGIFFSKVELVVNIEDCLKP